ncbi:uncharacterized protein LTR77_006852 [Saxophila tyrrhenica]|uniref:Uncharacterized protein n=1 Tax=Saxophila tyrrhenica TaxID=1690608 RepID=A0AAV9P8W0_9PEZI|nr:hypothetical protein LTR77_006852 [Saxophila tyrrhenica]
MDFPTPPPTSGKQIRFMQGPKHPEYYEDLYGKFNEEETVEGKADRCESDESSDEDVEQPDSPSKKTTVDLGFFKRLAAPKSKEALPEFELEQFGERKLRKGRGVFDYVNKLDAPLPHSYHEGGEGYKIAPSVNPKHSIAAPRKTPARKLIPHKNGMFGTPSSARMPYFADGYEDGYENNSAGEMMDDMLGPVSPPAARNDDPAVDSTVATPKKKKLTRGKSLVIDPALLTDEQGAFDGEAEGYEGNVSETNGNTVAMNRIPKSKTKKKSAANQLLNGITALPASSASLLSLKEEVHRSAANAFASSKRRTSCAHIPTHRERQKAEQKKEQKALLKQFKASPLGRVTSNSGKGVARSEKVWRLRNWKGEKIASGTGMVVVEEGEVEDVREFVRYDE